MATAVESEADIRRRAIARWCEVRIGELLGKAEKGGDRRKTKSVATDMNGSARTDRYQFRLLAAPSRWWPS